MNREYSKAWLLVLVESNVIFIIILPSFMQLCLDFNKRIVCSFYVFRF